MNITILRSGALVTVLMCGAFTAALADGQHGHDFVHGGGRGNFHGGGVVHAPPHSVAGARFGNIAPMERHGFVGRPHGYAPRPSYGVPSHPSPRFVTPHTRYRYGYNDRGYAPAWPQRHWQGGYWRGTYWPQVHYYSGIPWFVTALPLGYTTLWFGSMPYYYVNDVYYTHSIADNGYVLTDPPPAADEDSVEVDGDENTSGKVFAYPMKGQSEDEQAADRQECQEWASTHAGDETDGAAVTSSDYRRAMTACLTGRGYSAK